MLKFAKFAQLCTALNLKIDNSFTLLHSYQLLGKITTLLLALRNEMQPAKMVFDQICSLGKFVQIYHFSW